MSSTSQTNKQDWADVEHYGRTCDRWEWNYVWHGLKLNKETNAIVVKYFRDAESRVLPIIRRIRENVY